MMITRALWVSWVALGLIVGGCGKSAEAPPAPQAQPGEPVVTAPEAARGDEAAQPRRGLDTPAKVDPPAGVDPPVVADDAGADDALWLPASALSPGVVEGLGAGVHGAEALSFLPPRVAGVFIAASPAATLRAIGYEALKKAAGAMAEAASADLVERTGVDLLDLAAWAELGLNLDAPAGVASFASNTESFAIFATIGDRAKLDAAMAAAAQRGEVELKRERVGDAELLTVAGYDRSVIVLRGGTVLVVGVAERVGAEALGRRIATQPTDTAFSRTVELGQAVKGLAFSPHALIWGNFGLGAQLMLEDAGDARDPDLALGRAILGPARGLAIGLRATERAVEASVFLPLPKDALMMRLVRNTTGLPAVFTATLERPLLAWAARWEPAVLMELLELALAAGGESIDDVRAIAREVGGIDLDKDVIGAFTGEVAMVVGGELERVMELGPQALRGAVMIGLSRPDALQKLFAAAAGIEGLPPGLSFREGKGFDVALPGGENLRVEVVGSQLVATNDPGFVARLAAKEGRGFIDTLGHPELTANFGRPDQASWLLLSQAVVAAWLMVESSDHVEMPRPSGESSPEVAAIEARMDALRGQLAALGAERERREEELRQDILSKLGSFAQTARVTDGGLQVQIGQYTNAPLSELLAGLVRASAIEAQTDVDQAGRIYEELFKLENELRNLELKEELEGE